jgi:hypothetical protein
LPWRGRITGSIAPGRAGSPDGTPAATIEIDAFFGTASAAQFSRSGDNVVYTGPDQWRYRRFILHYAHLCAAAGGVESFVIGSEMRALTQLRGGNHSFPAVTRLRQLAGDVRAILGPQCKISYAADWSEYFGAHVDGNVYFHLDPLWGDANIDYIAIDNYMPLSDWRAGAGHADAHWGSVLNVDYLAANVAGGEGYDWYYASPEDEAAQGLGPGMDNQRQRPLGNHQRVEEPDDAVQRIQPQRRAAGHRQPPGTRLRAPDWPPARLTFATSRLSSRVSFSKSSAVTFWPSIS